MARPRKLDANDLHTARMMHILKADRPSVVVHRDKDSDGVIYAYNTIKNGVVKPVALCFAGSAVKPIAWVSFQNDKARESYGLKFFEGRRATKKLKDDATASRRRARSIDIGDILVASWGYDQTQVDAYQVVALRGQSSVELRPIIVETVRDSTDMSDVVKPVKDKFAARETFVKRVAYGDSVKIDSSATAFKWDGKREYHRSWYR